MGSPRWVGLGVVGAIAAMASCNQVLGNEEGHLAASGGTAGAAGAAGDGGPDGGGCLATLLAATASSLGGHDKMKWATQLAPQASLNKSSLSSAALVGGDLVVCGEAVEVMVGQTKLVTGPNVIARLNPNDGTVTEAQSESAPDCRVAAIGGTPDFAVASPFVGQANIMNHTYTSADQSYALARVNPVFYATAWGMIQGEGPNHYLVTRPNGGCYLALAWNNSLGGSVYAVDKSMVATAIGPIGVDVDAIAASENAIYVVFPTSSSVVQLTSTKTLDVGDPNDVRILAKYTDSGAYVWHKVFRGVTSANVAAASQGASVVLTAKSSTLGIDDVERAACSQGFSSFLLQYDAQGNLQWGRSFDGGPWSVARSDSETYLSGKQMAVDGKTVTVNNGGVVARVNGNGDLDWIQTLETGQAAGLVSQSSGGVWAYGTYAGTFAGPTTLQGASGGTDFIAAF